MIRVFWTGIFPLIFSNEAAVSNCSIFVCKTLTVQNGRSSGLKVMFSLRCFSWYSNWGPCFDLHGGECEKRITAKLENRHFGFVKPNQDNRFHLKKDKIMYKTRLCK